MKIIDAQVHIWSQTVVPTSGLHRKVSKFTAEEVLKEMDEAGVDAALIHPPLSWDPNSNALAIEAAKKYPDRFADHGPVSRSTEPGQPQADPRLAQPARHDGPALGAAVAEPAEVAARRHARLALAGCREGRPADRHDGRPVPDEVPRDRRAPSAAEADHRPLRAQPPGQDAEAFIHLDELVALARLPNVAVKATGAPHYSTQPYPFRNIQDGLHRIFDAYGPNRFFWGTDITRMPCSYRQCVTFFTEELPWLKGQDLEKVMGRGLCEWIGWNYRFD